MNSEPGISRLRLKKRAPVLGILVVLCLYYTFVSTAGTFEVLKSRTNFYDWLAEGFQAGHLYIPVTPKARLLKRADPWHYKSDREWDDWLWDASLYNRHYYIYWGPVPALLLLTIKVLTPYAQTIHDQWLVLLFMVLRLCAGAALIRLYARTQYPTLSDWVVNLAIVVFGLASPSPYFLARPLVYEASVAGGQAFLFAGLYCAYRGLLQASAQMRWFALAGTCFACAMGSRGSLLVATPLVMLATIFCAQRLAGFPLRGLLRSSLSIGAPFAVGLALYGLYNYLRFDSALEFGLKYQLTGAAFSNDNRWFLPNVVSYLTSELRWSCTFPFARLPRKRHLTSLITWPDDYDTGDRWNGETVAGVLIAMTICWFWLAWIWRAAISFKRDDIDGGLRAADASVANRELWLALVSLAAICSLAPASRMWMANMRFLQDAAGGILLGAIGAAFWLLGSEKFPSTRTRLRRGLRALYAALALHTAFVGVCLGFSGHTNSFFTENENLSKQLVKRLSVCRIQRELKQLVERDPSVSGERTAMQEP